jgi:hypothetical protein
MMIRLTRIDMKIALQSDLVFGAGMILIRMSQLSLLTPDQHIFQDMAVVVQV